MKGFITYELEGEPLELITKEEIATWAIDNASLKDVPEDGILCHVLHATVFETRDAAHAAIARTKEFKAKHPDFCQWAKNFGTMELV